MGDVIGTEMVVRAGARTSEKNMRRIAQTNPPYRTLCHAIRQKLPFFVTLHVRNLLDTYDPHLMNIGHPLQYLFDTILFQCTHAIAQRGY